MQKKANNKVNKVNAAQQAVAQEQSQAQEQAVAQEQQAPKPDKYSGSWALMPKKYVRLITQDVLRGIPYRDAVKEHIEGHKKWIQPDQSRLKAEVMSLGSLYIIERGFFGLIGELHYSQQARGGEPGEQAAIVEQVLAIFRQWKVPTDVRQAAEGEDQAQNVPGAGLFVPVYERDEQGNVVRDKFGKPVVESEPAYPIATKGSAHRPSAIALSVLASKAEDHPYSRFFDALESRSSTGETTTTVGDMFEQYDLFELDL